MSLIQTPRMSSAVSKYPANQPIRPAYVVTPTRAVPVDRSTRKLALKSHITRLDRTLTSSSIKSGFCPGDNSVQCCVKNAPAPPTIPAPKPECVHPPRDSCDFYSDCLEDKYHCGPDGYPIGYGLKFCNIFGAAKPRFTAQGQKWVSDTMLCLQTALVPYATDQTTSCANLKTFAFGTHPRCYVDSGYCDLAKEDLKVIQSLVDPKELFSSLDSIKAVLQTAIECTAVYQWWIDNRVVRVVGNVGGKAGDVWRKVTSWF